MTLRFPLEDFPKCKILVIGDIMLDRYWFGDANRISPEAPVPIVNIKDRQDRLGGAANVASNIVSLGAAATLVGIVGRDEPGLRIENLLKLHNINCNLIFDSNLESTLKIRVLGNRQQLLRIDSESYPSNESTIKLEEMVYSMISDYDMLVISDYAKGSLSGVSNLIRIAKKNSVPVFVDPKGNDFFKYKDVSLITPNLSEINNIIGRWKNEYELHYLIKNLIKDLNIDALLLTRSDQGMTLFTDDRIKHIIANAHEVFDVSGAGDTVIAVLAVCYSSGLTLDDSMYWANKAGGIVVEKLGTSTVNCHELLKRK